MTPPGKALCIQHIQLLARAAPDDGCFVEIGVGSGYSAEALYEVAMERDQPIFLYDTFAGHPFYDPTIDKDPLGFRNYDNFDSIRERFPRARVVKGAFPMSIEPDMQRVAFAHIDVDQYQSTLLSAVVLRPLMLDDSIMLFDDYGKHFGCRKAVNELFDPDEFHQIPVTNRAVKSFGPPIEQRMVWAEVITAVKKYRLELQGLAIIDEREDSNVQSSGRMGC